MSRLLVWLLAAAAVGVVRVAAASDPVRLVAGASGVVATGGARQIRLSDGTRLAATLWLPHGPGPFPTVLQLTPYDHTAPWITGWAPAFRSRGIAFLAVDVRGRYGSEGEWDPLVHEAGDAREVFRWVAAQPWCNGRIATFGGSYEAWVQLLAAAAGAPELDAMVPLAVPPDPFENVPFDGGAFSASAWLWAVTNRGRTMEAEPLGRDLAAAMRTYPIVSWDDRVGLAVPWLDAWLSHWRTDEFWRARSYEAGLGNVRVPVFLASGWFDGDQPGSVRVFQALRRHADTAVRDGVRLVLGPWQHSLSHVRRLGAMSFPETARRALDAEVLDWLAQRLAGAAPAAHAPVEYYLMGRDEWRTAHEWPPEDSRELVLHLAPRGRLTPGRPAPAAAGYVYDPADPTPLAAAQADVTQAVGHVPHDVAGVLARRDVLLFATEPLRAPLAVAGPVALELSFTSSAEDTDMAAQLLDLGPDGRAVSITHGLARARFRGGYAAPEPLLPGQPAALEVDLWSTAYELAAGHRLGVLVSSAQVPAFDAHRNLYDDLARGTAWTTATQTVLMGGEQPSRLRIWVLKEMVR